MVRGYKRLLLTVIDVTLVYEISDTWSGGYYHMVRGLLSHGQGVIITWSGGYYHMVRGLLSHGQGVIINHLYCLLGGLDGGVPNSIFNKKKFVLIRDSISEISP